MPQRKPLDLESCPSFTVPLRQRTAPQGYECCMSCAVKGNPAPRVAWYRNNVCLNTNPDYHITNVCGVCSLLILRVRPKDHGEYKVVIESKLGMAESSMMLGVRGITTDWDMLCLFWRERLTISIWCYLFAEWRTDEAAGHKTDIFSFLTLICSLARIKSTLWELKQL